MPCQIVACVIKKELHLARYGLAAADPYMMSLDILVERFCYDLQPAESGLIVAESRGDTLDRSLELAWINLKLAGTKFIKAVTLKQKITNLVIRPKKDMIAGLEIADLVISPIARYVMNKPTRQDFAIVQQKLRGWPRKHLGHGLVILPK